MKIFKRFLLIGSLGLAMVLLLSAPTSAQVGFRVTVQNQLVITGGIFQFDVFVVDTGSTTWRIADVSLQLTYNSAAFSDRSVSYVSGSSDLTGYSIDFAIPPINPQRIGIEIQSPSTFSSSIQVSTGDGTKIGTFQVSTISDFSLNMNLDWRTPILTYQVINQRIAAGDSIKNVTANGRFVTPANATLPIQLASFAANLVRDSEVEVVWRTVSETNNYGFEVYRKRGETGEWKKLGFVEGHGTTLAPQSYAYVDKSLSFGKYFYRIKQIDLDGKSEIFPKGTPSEPEMEVSVGAGPDKFVLTQNYPNPFNPSTLIDFVVPKSGPAALKVYNILGQEVATLFEGSAEAGKIYTAQLTAWRLASGLYFYTLRSSGKVETKRMMLLK